MLCHLKSTHPDIDVICGNVVTYEQAAQLLRHGADGLRVGMGSGSICTTQEVCAVGRGQASAVYDVARCCKNEGYDVPVTADGGIRNSADVIKALGLGASSVMCGSLFAGTDEALGNLTDDGFKTYRGMGSLDAMLKGSDQSYHADGQAIIVTQGVSGKVKHKGSAARLLQQMEMTMKYGFQDLGQRTVPALHQALFNKQLHLEQRTLSAVCEGGVHDLY